MAKRSRGILGSFKKGFMTDSPQAMAGRKIAKVALSKREKELAKPIKRSKKHKARINKKKENKHLRKQYKDVKEGDDFKSYFDRRFDKKKKVAKTAAKVGRAAIGEATEEAAQNMVRNTMNREVGKPEGRAARGRDLPKAPADNMAKKKKKKKAKKPMRSKWGSLTERGAKAELKAFKKKEKKERGY